MNNPYRKPYKVFVALIDQKGLNDPSIVVLENDFNTSVSGNRINIGRYDLTFGKSIFPDFDKVCIIWGSPCTDATSGSIPMLVQSDLYDPLQVNAYYFSTYDADGSVVDGTVDTCLYRTYLEIRVYD